ncbi:hypothetical protein EZI45_02580 [Delftia tsuruhatensis]|uniref:hypothetical protein n=1 Tax=Delftia tsuruhatensis TaxID=180282 RepID=UPI0010542C79|nr:hypothetical protein [Delftia tsuruhatensis]TDF32982.1 hypothetical protein EZI45_02580 [Delftia tsuruhatensis]
MASLVDTSVKHFLSTMYGAPVQNGQVGSKIAVLDACLVTGFGLRAATRITVAAGVATVEFSVGASQPPTPDSVLLIAGAAQALLNGEQRVTESASGVFKFRTAAPDSVDNGTGITFKFAALGWAKPFSGTNQAVYRSTDPQSLGMYLYVDDRTTTAASMRGYESMSAIDTGSSPFPTVAQRADGCWWAKSGTANATATRWLVVGDSRFFVDNTAPATSSTATSTAGGTRAFGDLLALRRTGDAYACLLCGGTSQGNVTAGPNNGSLDTASSNWYFLPRAMTGLGGSVAPELRSYAGSVNAGSGADSGLGIFPSDVDGELKLSQLYLNNAPGNTNTPRAVVPGYRYVPQSQVAQYFERDSTLIEAVSGRRLLALPHSGSAGAPSGYGFIDITGPWR